MVALFLAIILSFVPALFYVWVVYAMDRYEQEPLHLLGGVFLWGGLVATLGAIIIGTVVEMGLLLTTGSEAITSFAGTSLVAPLVEESLKGVAVLLIFLLVRHEFDSVLDGIIYASVVALGFAATENVLYLFFAGYQEEGYAGLFVLFALRVILGGWNHAVYTSFIGIGFAITRMSRSLPIKILAPIVGWAIAVFVHSMHNTIATVLGELFGLGGIAVMLITDWFGWLIVFGVIIRAIFHEKHLVTSYLREEVEQQVITPQQYATACSMWGQFRERMRALFSKRYGATRRFFNLCGEIAHKKHQLHTVGEEKGNTARIEKLRAELQELAPAVRG